MATRPDATLNLASLLRQAPGADVEAYGEGLLAPDETTLEALGLRLDGPLAWELTARNTGGDEFLIEGSVSGTALIECRRCLDEVPTSVESTLFYPALYRPGTAELTLVEESEDGEDLLVFGHPSVDFAALLAQVFAIDLPLTALCDETCRGLSPDGINLNRHPEAAATAASTTTGRESPFAPLKDLDLDE